MAQCPPKYAPVLVSFFMFKHIQGCEQPKEKTLKNKLMSAKGSHYQGV